MLRYLNVVAILALIGAAIYAYSIKYETILFAEQIVKMKNANQRERDTIAMLRAEFAHLIRPGRIQALADKHLDLKQLAIDQIVQPQDLPEKAAAVDSIGKKLDLLGLGEATPMPRDTTGTIRGATTPSARARQEMR
jgi:hypothetical protein